MAEANNCFLRNEVVPEQNWACEPCVAEKNEPKYASICFSPGRARPINNRPQVNNLPHSHSESGLRVRSVTGSELLDSVRKITVRGW